MAFKDKMVAFAKQLGVEAIVPHDEIVALPLLLENGNKLVVTVTLWGDTVEFEAACVLISFDKPEQAPVELMARMLVENNYAKRGYWSMKQGLEGKWYFTVIDNFPEVSLDFEEFEKRLRAVVSKLNRFEEALAEMASYLSSR